MKSKLKRILKNYYLRHIHSNPNFHIGHRYKCPICGFNAASFSEINVNKTAECKRNIIGNGRRKCVCWRCKSTDRDRLVYLYLNEKLDLFHGTTDFKVLHIAPETQLAKKIMENKHIRYEAGDYFMPGYSYPDFVSKMNILSLEQQDSTYDLIISCHVLEHIKDDLKAMRELYRVLKVGGIAILQVPLCPDLKITEEEDTPTMTVAERIAKFGQRNHVRLYGLDYKERLEKVGFTVECYKPKAAYAKYGVNMNEVLYIGKKL